MQDTWSLPGKKCMWMEYLFHAIRLSFDYFCWLFSNVRMFCMLFIKLFWLFTQTHDFLHITSHRYISSEVHNNLYLMELIS